MNYMRIHYIGIIHEFILNSKIDKNILNMSKLILSERKYLDKENTRRKVPASSTQKKKK